MRRKAMQQGSSCLAIAIIFVLTALVSPSYSVGIGNISGTVTDGSGNLIPGVEVSAYDLQDTSGFPPIPVTTDSNGIYIIPDLPIGEKRYKVLFVRTGYLDQWYNNAPMSDCAEPVTVPDNDTTTADAVLVPGTSSKSQKRIAAIAPAQSPLNSSSLSGRVTLNGTAFKCAKVEAYNAADGTYIDTGLILTDYQGNYTISGLALGSYKILFYDQHNNPTQWYERKTKFSSATAVAETASGVDAAFPMASHVPVINLLLK